MLLPSKKTPFVLSAALILAAALLLAVVACAPDTGNPDGGVTDAAKLPLCADGAFIYTAVRPEGSSTWFTGAFADFGSELRETLGVSLEMKTDWIRVSSDGAIVNNEDEYEMLIGKTNRAESKAAAELIGGDSDYIIKIDGKKLIILGGNEESTINAMNYFAAYLKASEGKIDENYSYSFSLMAEGGVLSRIMKEYVIIRAENGGKRAASAGADLKLGLEGMAGNESNITIKTDWVMGAERGALLDTEEREILVGETNRLQSDEASKGLSCMDYRITVTGPKITVTGGCSFAVARGCTKLIELISDGAIFSLDAEYEYTEDFEALYPPNPLIYDASGFVPVWASSFEVPSWLTDMREKVRALSSGTDARLTSIAHRGDMYYYPENSVEGILSACLAGADSVEVDLRLSADGVPVMMHDETLKRTTDWQQKRGKNGLPISDRVEDWTYAQLRELRLKKADGTVTDYLIPTFYETLAILGGRSFLRLDDKLSMINEDEDIAPIALETHSLDSCIHRYGAATINKWLKNGEPDAAASEFISYFSETIHLKTFRASYWPNEENTYQNMIETPEYWEGMRASGKMNIWCNRIVDICKHIAANDKGTP